MSKQKDGLVLLCTIDGAVQSILLDSASWIQGQAENFLAIVDSGSTAKAQEFLSMVYEHSVVMSWELRLTAHHHTDTWLFNGVRVPNGLLVIGLPTPDIDLLQTALSEINNDLMNSQRLLAKQNVQLQQLYRDNVRHTDYLWALHEATLWIREEMEPETVLQRIREGVHKLASQAHEIVMYERPRDVPETMAAQFQEATVRDKGVILDPPGILLPLKIRPGQEGALYLSGTFNNEDLRRLEVFMVAANSVLRHASLLEHVRHQAVTDHLTGLYNRRGWQDLASREIASARRFQNPLSLLMIDIDNFKPINDHRGHVTGDHVLIHLARLIRENVRAVDIAGRHGGEEFLVLLPQTGCSEALIVANKLRELVSSTPVPTTREPISITVSIGVACLSEGQSLEELIHIADQAMYKAKQAGRNSVAM
jgi:diguanylate cyclase (GGDEF)-like protein